MHKNIKDSLGGKLHHLCKTQTSFLIFSSHALCLLQPAEQHFNSVKVLASWADKKLNKNQT